MTQLTSLKAHRPHNADVGDFINNKLREIDNDPVQPPYDSLQEYAYEGEGSLYGSSLSSLDIKLDNEKQTNNGNDSSRKRTDNSNSSRKRMSSTDVDLAECVNWGPKFNKISDLYDIKKEERDEQNNRNFFHHFFFSIYLYVTNT